MFIKFHEIWESQVNGYTAESLGSLVFEGLIELMFSIVM